MTNARNRLLEFMKELGYYEDCVSYVTEFDDEQGCFISKAKLTIKDGRVIEGMGSASTKKDAQIDASQSILDIIDDQHPDLKIDWDQIRMEAQAGDGLIKLCAYLSDEFSTAAEKSFWLQKMESDAHMVEIFDRLKAGDDPSVILFGNNLGQKRKATWIEALIWEKFGAAFNTPGTVQGLKGLASFLGDGEIIDK